MATNTKTTKKKTKEVTKLDALNSFTAKVRRTVLSEDRLTVEETARVLRDVANELYSKSTQLADVAYENVRYNYPAGKVLNAGKQ